MKDTTHLYIDSGILDAGDNQSWADVEVVAAVGSDGHSVDTMPVFDFITIFINASGSGNRGVTTIVLKDAITGTAFWTGGLTLEAGDADTLHVTFPSGLPERATGGTSAETHAQPLLHVNTELTSSTIAFTIGYHFERAAFRR